MGGGGMWFRDLEARLTDRRDLLLYLAWYKLRHPVKDAEPDEDPTIRRQQAEALAHLDD